MFNLKAVQSITKKAKDKLQESMAQTVTIKLLHGLNAHEATVPCFLTFGQLKETARALTGVPIQHLKLNFKGRDKPDTDTLAGAGVKNGSKIFVGESDEYKAQIAAQREPQPAAAPPPEPQHFPQPAMSPLPALSPMGGSPFPPSGARAPPPTPVPTRPRPTAMTEADMSRNAIGKVAQQVDELQSQMVGLPSSGNAKQEAVKLVELLTQKLLQLDGIDVTPETRQLRKDQINRINALCDKLEQLKTSTSGDKRT